MPALVLGQWMSLLMTGSQNTSPGMFGMDTRSVVVVVLVVVVGTPVVVLTVVVVVVGEVVVVGGNVVVVLVVNVVVVLSVVEGVGVVVGRVIYFLVDVASIIRSKICLAVYPFYYPIQESIKLLLNPDLALISILCFY